MPEKIVLLTKETALAWQDALASKGKKAPIGHPWDLPQHIDTHAVAVELDEWVYPGHASTFPTSAKGYILRWKETGWIKTDTKVTVIDRLNLYSPHHPGRRCVTIPFGKEFQIISPRAGGFLAEITREGPAYTGPDGSLALTAKIYYFPYGHEVAETEEILAWDVHGIVHKRWADNENKNLLGHWVIVEFDGESSQEWIITAYGTGSADDRDDIIGYDFPTVTLLKVGDLYDPFHTYELRSNKTTYHFRNGMYWNEEDCGDQTHTFSTPGLEPDDWASICTYFRLKGISGLTEAEFDAFMRARGGAVPGGLQNGGFQMLPGLWNGRPQWGGLGNNNGWNIRWDGNRWIIGQWQPGKQNPDFGWGQQVPEPGQPVPQKPQDAPFNDAIGDAPEAEIVLTGEDFLLQDCVEPASIDKMVGSSKLQWQVGQFIRWRDANGEHCGEVVDLPTGSETYVADNWMPVGTFQSCLECGATPVLQDCSSSNRIRFKGAASLGWQAGQVIKWNYKYCPDPKDHCAEVLEDAKYPTKELSAGSWEALNIYDSCEECKQNYGDPCIYCGDEGTPKEYYVTLSGIQNRDCEQCNVYNGTWVLTQKFPNLPCVFRADLPQTCTAAQPPDEPAKSFINLTTSAGSKFLQLYIDGMEYADWLIYDSPATCWCDEDIPQTIGYNFFLCNASSVTCHLRAAQAED